jgi:hypothetical protein
VRRLERYLKKAGDEEEEDIGRRIRHLKENEIYD